jgi:hypothetical protein
MPILTQKDLWRIYCQTDNKWEFIWNGTEPSACPFNASHTVNLNSAQIDETYHIDLDILNADFYDMYINQSLLQYEMEDMQHNMSILQYEIQDLEANQTILDYEMEDMQHNISILQYEIHDLEANQTILDYEMEDMQSNMTLLQYQIDDLHVNQTELQSIKYNSSNNIAFYWDEKETGTNGGTFPNNTWVIRDINANMISNVSYFDLNTTTNSIIIKRPGNYIISASAPGCNVQNHKIRLYNTNTSSIEIYGTTSFSANECTRSFLEKEIIIFDWTEFQIQHYCYNEIINNGLGKAIGIDEINEIYTNIKILRIENANIYSALSDLTSQLFDKKETGTNGGTFNSCIWQTRNLNFINDNLSFFTCIINNQIILNPGSYIFTAKVPATGVKHHLARLYNISNSTIEKIGTVSYSYSETTYCIIETYIQITSETIYEIQHYCETTQINWGFGKSVGIDGVKETFTLVTIIKLCGL